MAVALVPAVEPEVEAAEVLSSSLPQVIFAFHRLELSWFEGAMEEALQAFLEAAVAEVVADRLCSLPEGGFGWMDQGSFPLNPMQ